jgi:hypothetical protein
MRTAAKELGRDRIRVNSVHPGIINTPLAYSKTGEELVPVDNFPIPRQATPEEIAGYVLFVASEDAAFSTGTEFIADGGFLFGPNEPADAADHPTAGRSPHRTPGDQPRDRLRPGPRPGAMGPLRGRTP